MCWESSGEGAEICHDDSYKSSQYWNPIMILVDVLMMVKWLGLLYLYALTNETSQKAFGTTITRKKNKNQMYPSGTPNWTKTMCL